MLAEGHTEGPREVREKAQEDWDASRADHARAASLIPGPTPTPGGSAVLTVLYPPGKKASPAFFSPLLTVNSEYWLVEFRNFPLDHWSEVLFQLVVVLLKFLLILPLICCDETLVFLYGFPTSEMQISGGEKRRLYFIEILYI